MNNWNELKKKKKYSNRIQRRKKHKQPAYKELENLSIVETFIIIHYFHCIQIIYEFLLFDLLLHKLDDNDKET